ncbi:MAG: nucleotidyltransferase family protein [Anaerolineales bacterium]|nr:nucleotidyltransferase family protein [Anaerolineales bacterium]MCX7608542.1 nucleotidyltransferase family protein [Anaerolineales bacterium]
MNAIVTAGGIPLPQEPLYIETKGHNKALLEIAGKPMIQWVLDALGESKHVDHVIVVGLTEKSGLSCKKPLYYIPNQGKMLNNFRAGVQKAIELGTKRDQHVLFVSADIPAITGEMVDWVIETALQTDEDVYYNIIPREVMEQRFPDARRTWTKLRDMEVCGGDMNVVRARLVVDNSEDSLWEKISDARKSPLKQAALIGLDTLLLLLFRRLTLEKAVEKIKKRLNITGRAIVCPYAEIGMDVDKPHHLEIIRADFEKRLTKNT